MRSKRPLKYSCGIRKILPVLFWVTLACLSIAFSNSHRSNFTSTTIVTQDSLDTKSLLGRYLFYDKLLSRDSSISCANCHNQKLAFTDGKQKSIGIRGQQVNRNAPTLTNVANRTKFLLDGVNPSLEAQVLVPIQEHREFDFHILLLAERLKQVSFYDSLSWQAYNRELDPYVITHSIAEFERQISSYNSRYDQFLAGNTNLLNRKEYQGMKIFTEKLYCTECHSGIDLTNEQLTNNGLYRIYADSGRMRLTEKESDRAIFKVPTLRNIELTAPYMHDGSLATLEDVIDHYSSGGQNHPNKSTTIQPFQLTVEEKSDLIVFLKTLTDSTLIHSKSLSNPFND